LPPAQWVPGTLTSGERQPGREADHIYFVPRLRISGVIPTLHHTLSMSAQRRVYLHNVRVICCHTTLFIVTRGSQIRRKVVPVT